MKTGFFYDPIFLCHQTGSHPESSQRLEAINRHLKEKRLLKNFILYPSRKAEVDELSLIHSRHYIGRLEMASFLGRHTFGTDDCIISDYSFDVARHAVGAVIDAVIEVSENRLDNAFCAVRPPGHHAEREEAMGFCFFNNAAIAAEYLVQKMGCKKILIFDFDVHHGNGTQHFFEERADVFYASIHQDPKTCYPGTGFAEERGKGNGIGYTLNCPMLPNSKDEHYIEVLHQVLIPAFRKFEPEFIILSSGFDAHQSDPLANIQLTQYGFDVIITELKKISEQYAHGRLVSILEGGYNLKALAECVSSHMVIMNEGPTRIPKKPLLEELRAFFSQKIKKNKQKLEWW
ncbi:histone deacetylase [Deltaproteobacteria bacterium TL4]